MARILPRCQGPPWSPRRSANHRISPCQTAPRDRVWPVDRDRNLSIVTAQRDGPPREQMSAAEGSRKDRGYERADRGRSRSQ